MKNKKVFLTIQAFLISCFNFGLNKIPGIDFLNEFKTFLPTVSFVLSYYLAIFISLNSFKSFEEIRFEKATKKVVKKIDNLLNDPMILDKKKKELRKMREDVLCNSLNTYCEYRENCKKDLEETLKD